MHEIIFPPQATVVATDKSRVIDADPDYGLDKEEWVRGYDPDLVEGHVRITYDDATDRLTCVISDLRPGTSTLPPEAYAALEACMAPVDIEPAPEPAQ